MRQSECRKVSMMASTDVDGDDIGKRGDTVEMDAKADGLRSGGSVALKKQAGDHRQRSGDLSGIDS